MCSIAGVAVSWLARLEQGRAHSVSPDVLGALAEALRLDETERIHLFGLAGFRATPAPAGHLEMTRALRILLDELDPNPAYVLDRCWNIIGWNEAEAQLFPGLLDHTDAPPNLLRLVFSSESLEQMMVDHREEAVRLVAQFRLHTAQWPDDGELRELVRTMQSESSLFAELWAANDVAPFATTRRVFAHPRAGRLEFDHHRFAALDQAGTQLVVYTPVPGTDSAARLSAAGSGA